MVARKALFLLQMPYKMQFFVSNSQAMGQPTANISDDGVVPTKLSGLFSSSLCYEMSLISKYQTNSHVVSLKLLKWVIRLIL